MGQQPLGLGCPGVALEVTASWVPMTLETCPHMSCMCSTSPEALLLPRPRTSRGPEPCVPGSPGVSGPSIAQLHVTKPSKSAAEWNNRDKVTWPRPHSLRAGELALKPAAGSQAQAALLR